MPTGSQVPSLRLVTQVVEASCGKCQLNMEGSGCDLAVRINGKSYFVDVAKTSRESNQRIADRSRATRAVGVQMCSFAAVDACSCVTASRISVPAKMLSK